MSGNGCLDHFLFMFYFSKHVCLSLVCDCDGGRSLLPWLPIHLHWQMLPDYNLSEKERERKREGE